MTPLQRALLLLLEYPPASIYGGVTAKSMASWSGTPCKAVEDALDGLAREGILLRLGAYFWILPDPLALPEPNPWRNP